MELPKKLSNFPTTLLIYIIYPVIWINQNWQIIELPYHAYYFHFLVTFVFLTIFAIRQWYQSRNSVTEQAALHWLLLSTTLILGITVSLFYIPAVYSTQALISVSGAYFVVFMIFLGLIMGIIKYQLFNLSRIWMEIWVWIIGGSVLLLIDILLIYVLEATSSIAFILSALIVGWFYFPAREWFSVNILKLQPRSIEHYFPLLIQKLIGLKPDQSINEKWEEILYEIFLPLEITNIIKPQNKIKIIENGACLLVPSLDNKSTLSLQYQNNGKKLYANNDIKLCESLYKITQYTASIKQAHEEGIQIERQRITRDLNDNIVIQLTALANKTVESQVTKKAHKILKSLNETISSLDTKAMTSIQIILDDLLKDIATRASLAELKLNINKQLLSDNKKLNPRQSINLKRIVQETISNIIKHAAASQISIVIKTSESMLKMEICDDGIGGNKKDWIAGKGLNNIKKRILEIDGIVSWENNSQPSHKGNQNGCCVNFQFPI